MANRKMISKGDTVMRSVREKEFEYLISRETLRDVIFSIQKEFELQ
jgi:hypothetical protein